MSSCSVIESSNKPVWTLLNISADFYDIINNSYFFILFYYPLNENASIPTAFMNISLFPGANHQANRPGNGGEGGHQFQCGDWREGSKLH